MAESLVHRAAVQGNAAHALVIGVGDYPHLAGGSGAPFPGRENMGQLGASPISARRFAEWLIGPEGYHDPDRPLASVRLLLSEKKGLFGGATRFKNPVTGQSHEVPTANLAEVTGAVDEWRAALDANEGDLALFFFSGHGVMVGLEQILLLADFGDPAARKVRGAAIRFNPFRSAMAGVAARDQIYFLDACRDYTETFATLLGAAGESFFDPPEKIFHRLAAQPVFNATISGQSAYGRDNEPSLFTDALLLALKGGGTDNRSPPYDWQILATLLNDAVGFLVQRRAEREGLGIAQIPSGYEIVQVSLGKLQGPPLIPVVLYCKPRDATALGQFSFASDLRWKFGEPDPLVKYGHYKFEVSFADPRYVPGSRELEIRPPYREVEVPVDQVPP